MSKEQIIEVVLDIYSSRKDAKEYFDFFLNPDVEKLLDRYRNLAVKEFSRNKRRWSKARITVIKRMVREFISFNVDSTAVVTLMTFIMKLAMETTWVYHTTATFQRSMLQFLESSIDYADKNIVWSLFVTQMDQLTAVRGKCSGEFHGSVKQTLKNFSAGRLLK